LKKNINVTEGTRAGIDRLHVLLQAQGVDTRNPKNPKAFSDSALLRFLVEDKLAQLSQAASVEGVKSK